MKKGTLLLIITILIIFIICFGIVIKLNKQENITPIGETNVGEPLKKVTDRNNFYMVENSVKKFYKYYALMYENIDEENIEVVYNLLDEKYINFKGITIENIKTIMPDIRSSVVNITNMYVSKQSETIVVYIVEGILREEISKNLSDFKIMVQIDSKNGTFSILLQDYIQEKHKDFAVGNIFRIEKLNNINVNRYNLYVLEDISDETYAIDLIDRYKEEILYNTELAYNNLDIEYRNAKFGTLGNFKEYVLNNKEKINNVKLEKYQITQQDNYTQYICVDQNGSYYIFRTTGIMKYILLLDNYTIDLPEFIEKYNKANTIKKAGYNIQKCIDAINNKDYAYVYNKLDFEFKAINYVTVENFEKDIKTKLFNRNKVKEVSGSNEGSTYIYKLTIVDVENNENEQAMTVIMQLKEGTDFVMSFSFE